MTTTEMPGKPAQVARDPKVHQIEIYPGKNDRSWRSDAIRGPGKTDTVGPAGRSLDARTDLFSLGGVLYVAAVGTPYPGDLSLLRTGRPDLPSTFRDLVASLLSESPDDRPTDAEDVLLRLDEIRHASNIDALIAAGESDSVEFKSSLHHRHEPLPLALQIQVERQVTSPERAEGEVQKQLKTGITKTIAAFVNTAGGTLLIGVSDWAQFLASSPISNTSPRGNETLILAAVLERGDRQGARP